MNIELVIIISDKVGQIATMSQIYGHKVLKKLKNTAVEGRTYTFPKTKQDRFLVQQSHVNIALIPEAILPEEAITMLSDESSSPRFSSQRPLIAKELVAVLSNDSNIKILKEELCGIRVR